MTSFIIVLIILIAVVLILVVLAQNSKGGGLTPGMSGASQVMGARRATDWIEKATWILASALFVLSVGVNVFIGQDTAANRILSPNVEKAKSEMSVPSLPSLPTGDTLSAPASELSLPEEAPAENEDQDNN